MNFEEQAVPLQHWVQSVGMQIVPVHAPHVWLVHATVLSQSHLAAIGGSSATTIVAPPNPNEKENNNPSMAIVPNVAFRITLPFENLTRNRTFGWHDTPPLPMSSKINEKPQEKKVANNEGKSRFGRTDRGACLARRAFCQLGLQDKLARQSVYESFRVR